MNLLYFTIGGNPIYAELLKLCIMTLVEKIEDMSSTHIMVMCSEEYVCYIQDIPYIHDIWMVPYSQRPDEISMKKVWIYMYPKIAEYDRVFYLDTDIVVINDIVRDVLPLMNDPEYLYVFEEFKEKQYHNQKYWGFRNYSHEQLALFEQKGQGVFNCGHFGFIPSPTMLQHFENVHKMMLSHVQNNYFYEQSFMNYYFNTRFLTKAVLNPFVYMPQYHKGKRPTHIIHVADVTKSPEKKYEELCSLYAEYQ